MNWREFAVLMLAGLGTAASVHFLDFSVRIPGHAILRSIIPIALGIAAVPRPLSGTMIGMGALASTWGFRFLGAEGVGMGALTSMALAGPILDVALRKARPGWDVYVRCALAGLSINALAYLVRFGGKASGVAISTRPLEQWWSGAAVSHLACGIIAGLISAGVAFPRGDHDPEPGQEDVE